MDRDVTQSDAAAQRAEQTERQAGLERRTDLARGQMLGLALGESIGLRGNHASSPTITAGVATQLAAFTLEGFIRTAVRFSHRGICHPPSVTGHLNAIATGVVVYWHRLIHGEPTTGVRTVDGFISDRCDPFRLSWCRNRAGPA